MLAMPVDEPRTVTLPVRNVTVDAVVRNRIERFSRTIQCGEQALRDLVDLFEGQVGTVLSVSDDSGKILFRSAVEAWEVIEGGFH
jgi:hypothetical protein